MVALLSTFHHLLYIIINFGFNFVCTCVFLFRTVTSGGFPGGLVVKNLPINAGDSGLIPGQEDSPEGGNGNSLQYSCLENFMDRGAWGATAHEVAK